MELPGSWDQAAILFATEATQEKEMYYSLRPAEGS